MFKSISFLDNPLATISQIEWYFRVSLVLNQAISFKILSATCSRVWFKIVTPERHFTNFECKYSTKLTGKVINQ